MSEPAKILLIEDDPSAASALQRVLQGDGYEVTLANRGDEGLTLAEQNVFDVVLTDLKMPGLNGLSLIEKLHAKKPRLPIILMTAHGTADTAIQATKIGAYDYLLKPFEMEDLLELLERAAESSRLIAEPVELGSPETSGDAIIGNSRLMQEIYKEVGRVAAKPVTVLLRGETGTGKELIARAVCQHSGRPNAPFVAVNCVAIPETLLESELFGHERGAFTGAELRRIGRFEQANHGTIFLDEIGDMSLSTQAKLLRVLQDKTIQRLGGKETIPVDVRVIAATHRNLEEAIQEKTFREDLFYRLSVVVIKLPPLRERPEDIPALVKYFLRRYGSELGFENTSIQPEAVDFLQTQTWPGNIRELENVLRRAMLLAQKYTITVEHIRQALARINQPLAISNQSLAGWISDYLAKAEAGKEDAIHGKILESVERELFQQAIALSKGNQAKAARWLGVSRITMREKLTHFGLRS